MPYLVSKKVSLWFLAALFVLLINAAVCFFSIERVVRNEQLVASSGDFIDRLRQVLADAIDAETGGRGFVITGLESYLEPYTAALSRLELALPRLRGHPAVARGGYQQEVARLEQLLAAKLAFMAETTEVRRTQGLEAATAMVATNKGKILMDQARAVVGGLQRKEGEQLNGWNIQSARSTRHAYATLGVVTVLNIGLLGALFRAVKEDTRIRRRANDAIRTSERRLRAMVDNADAIIFMKDLSGRYLLVNTGFVKARRLPREQIEGKTDADLFPAPLAEKFQEVDRQVFTEAKTLRYEETLEMEHGSHTYLSVRSLLRDEAGAPYAVCGVSTDITPRKRAEEALTEFAATLEQRVEQRTAQLTEANQQLEAFGYTVSHDLRAPLRGIQGFSEAVLEDYSEQIDETGREYLRRIAAGAKRLELLLEDLLAYSRLSRQEMSLGAAPLLNILNEALQQLQSDIMRTGAEIRVEEPMPAVLAHRATLIQIVQNLLANAIKFTARGAKPVVRVHAQMRGDAVRLWVSDNGIGIAPEHQGRIFQVFERLHGTESYPGTGIGLAIVKKGTERMGGSAGVDSTPGEGSRFWIQLPAAHPHK